MTTIQAPAPAPSTDDIIEAFVNGDCYFLALALAEQNPALQVGLLREENGDWIHAFAHDPSSDECIDVTGRSSSNNFTMDWDWIEWDHFTFHSLAEAQDMFKSVDRYHPSISIEDGLRVAAENGA